MALQLWAVQAGRLQALPGSLPPPQASRVGLAAFMMISWGTQFSETCKDKAKGGEEKRLISSGGRVHGKAGRDPAKHRTAQYRAVMG